MSSVLPSCLICYHLCYHISSLFCKPPCLPCYILPAVLPSCPLCASTYMSTLCHTWFVCVIHNARILCTSFGALSLPTDDVIVLSTVLSSCLLFPSCPVCYCPGPRCFRGVDVATVRSTLLPSCPPCYRPVHFVIYHPVHFVIYHPVHFVTVLPTVLLPFLSDYHIISSLAGTMSWSRDKDPIAFFGTSLSATINGPEASWVSNQPPNLSPYVRCFDGFGFLGHFYAHTWLKWAKDRTSWDDEEDEGSSPQIRCPGQELNQGPIDL